jgi:shikimate kinase
VDIVWTTGARSKVRRVIVLIGFMGAGKSTVGQLLANRLELPFYDVDRVIEQRAGTTIPQLFDRHGEAHFRALEQVTVTELVTGPEAVVALGGGAVEHDQVRTALLGARVVYLSVSHEQALSRVGGDAGRPMLRRADLAELHEHRTRAYRSVATLVVATDGRSAAAVADEIATTLRAR